MCISIKICRLCGLFLVLAAGCERPGEQTVSLPPPKVTVAHPIEREVVEEDEFNGWMQAAAEVEVRARVRGHIQKVHFQDGDLVAANQLLFELDPRPFQVQIDQAIAQANALSAQYAAAQKDAERYAELVRTGGASRQQLDKAQADAAAFQAQIAAKNEEVKQYQLDLEFSKITAPITGRISRAMLTEGNLVNAGGSDPLLTTIVATHPMYVYFPVDERALLRYRERRAQEGSLDKFNVRDRTIGFRFGLDSDEGFPYQGTIDFADNRIDPDTGTIQVRGLVDNQDGRFVAGSRVRVRVPVDEPHQAVLVPDSSILSDQDKRYVLVVDAKNVVSRRDVGLGQLLEDGLREIVPTGSGGPPLGPSDRLVVLGLQQARINYPVDPVDATASGSSTPAPATEGTSPPESAADTAERHST
jgi:RND family efflux transporter MFP subunit